MDWRWIIEVETLYFNFLTLVFQFLGLCGLFWYAYEARKQRIGVENQTKLFSEQLVLQQKGHELHVTENSDKKRIQLEFSGTRRIESDLFLDFTNKGPKVQQLAVSCGGKFELLVQPDHVLDEGKPGSIRIFDWPSNDDEVNGRVSIKLSYVDRDGCGRDEVYSLDPQTRNIIAGERA